MRICRRIVATTAAMVTAAKLLRIVREGRPGAADWAASSEVLQEGSAVSMATILQHVRIERRVPSGAGAAGEDGEVVRCCSAPDENSVIHTSAAHCTPHACEQNKTLCFSCEARAYWVRAPTREADTFPYHCLFPFQFPYRLPFRTGHRRPRTGSPAARTSGAPILGSVLASRPACCICACAHACRTHRIEHGAGLTTAVDDCLTAGLRDSKSWRGFVDAVRIGGWGTGLGGGRRGRGRRRVDRLWSRPARLGGLDT